MGSAIACCTTRDDTEEMAPAFAHPCDLNTAKQSDHRVVDCEDLEDREGRARQTSQGEASVLSFFSASESSTQRIASNVDLSSLENWWGIGPDIPDRRLEAAMPKHRTVSYVEEVVVRKAIAIQELRDQPGLFEKCTKEGQYVLFQLKLGKVCLLSLHHIVDNCMYERILNAGGGNICHDKLKFIVTPVNLVVRVPSKGPKDAETVGSFFGENNFYFNRPARNGGGFDIATISIDLYSVWSLKMLLPAVAFKSGRMVDFHLVSYVDNAVLVSYRAAMTPEVIERIKLIESN